MNAKNTSTDEILKSWMNPKKSNAFDSQFSYQTNTTDISGVELSFDQRKWKDERRYEGDFNASDI